MPTLPKVYGGCSKDDLDQLGTGECLRTQNLQRWLLRILGGR